MSDYGFHFSRKWWTDLGFGLVLGALLLFGVLALELAVGWVNDYRQPCPVPWASLCSHDPGRRRRRCGRSFGGGGVVSRIPDQKPGRGSRHSTVGDRHRCRDSAVHLGLAHATNPNATWLSTFNIVIFGVLFGTGYVLTGELALPIGLHFAWNLVQGFVFGVEPEETIRVDTRPHR